MVFHLRRPQQPVHLKTCVFSARQLYQWGFAKRPDSGAVCVGDDVFIKYTSLFFKSSVGLGGIKILFSG